MDCTYRRWKCKSDESEAWISPFTAALQVASLNYLVGVTLQGIAYQPVMLMIVGLQIGLFSYVTGLESAQREAAPHAVPTLVQARAEQRWAASGKRRAVTA